MKFKIKHSFYYYKNDETIEEYRLYMFDSDYSDFPWRSCGVFTSRQEAEEAAKRITKLHEPDVELVF